MMWHSLIRERKSQIFICVLIVLAIIMGLGAALLFHSRSAREISRMQGDAQRAYSLAKSGLDIGERLGAGAGFPKEYSIGGGTLKLTLEGTTLLISTGKVGASTRVLTRTIGGAPATTWAKTYGTSSKNEFLYFAEQTTGGYFLGGDNESDFIAIKTDDQGTITITDFAKTYGTSGYVETAGNTFCQIQGGQGGYILGGTSGSGGSDVVMIKILSNGLVDTSLAKIYDGGDSDRLYALKPTSNGYILGGATQSWKVKGIKFLVIKTDSSGNPSPTPNYWVSTYGASGNTSYYETLRALAVTPLATNQGYILAGESNINGTYDILLIKITEDGTVEWYKTYGGAGYDELRFIKQTSDGGYIFGGRSPLGPAGSGYNMLVIKTDGNGDIPASPPEGVKAWAHAYNVNNYDDNIYSIEETSSGYVLGGYTLYPTTGEGNEGILIGIDLDGNVKTWKKVYGKDSDTASKSDIIRSVRQTSDGGLILGGDSESYGKGLKDALLIKTESTGGLSGCTDFCRDAISVTGTDVSITPVIPTTSVTGVARSLTPGSITVTVGDLADPTTSVCP